MTIERIISACSTIPERYALHFARFYGVRCGGNAMPGAGQQEELPLTAEFTEARDWSSAVLANVAMADATILMRYRRRASKHDLFLQQMIEAADRPLLSLSFEQVDRIERVGQFFSTHRSLRSLHVTGHLPDTFVGDIDLSAELYGFVDGVLAAAYEIYQPGDPWKTMKPAGSVGMRLAELRRIYPTQFAAMPDRQFTPNAGWLDLVADLCKEVASILGDASDAFRWMQIVSRDGVLRCCYRVGQWPVLKSLTVVDAKRGLDPILRPALDVSQYIDLEQCVIAAEIRAMTLCELCGEPGQERMCGYWRVLCKRHSRPGWNPYALGRVL